MHQRMHLFFLIETGTKDKTKQTDGTYTEWQTDSLSD